ncbi:MAG: penicillin acylase family protein [Terracidiphilus sp.]
MPDKDSLDRRPAPGGESPPRSHKRRWPWILLLIAGGLLALLLLAAVAGVLWLRAAAKAALPVLDGDVHLAGLSAPVTVRRDAHGVPHIEAATQDDLFLAQGYVTAQDRLWQMDVYRRNANGELAEVFGSSQLEHDKAQRVLQFRNTARRIYASLSPFDRARLEAYARGVNLFIAQHQDALPPEFRLFGYRPRPWNGVDSLSIGMMLVQGLDTHWEVKLSRERIAAKLHNEKLENDLYPVGSWRDRPPTGIAPHLGQPQPTPPPRTGNDEDDEDDDEPSETRIPPASAPDFGALSGLNALPGLPGGPACDGCAYGSNNWVVAGKHTASGRPLLANDMHLSVNEPDIWYVADLKSADSHGSPGFHAAGVTLPGALGVIAGHNEHVAWGFTSLYADVQDLYIEKLQGNNYEAGDESWHPLGVDHEVIHVRGGKDVLLDVHLTDHGPLLNPILPKEKRPIALKWTLYDPTLNAMPIYEMDVAANWTEFSAALSAWCWPTQNVVYSDDQGHIAYHAVGRVPIRGLGTGIFNKPLPHDQLDLRFEWGLGWNTQLIYIPYDAMPHAVDPPSGFLATANSRVTTDKPHYDPFSNNDLSAIPLTHEWPDPYRVERIYKALEGRDQLTPADMLAVQTDVYSEVDQELGHRFAYAIDHTSGADERLRKAADLMRSWDGRLTTDSAAASIVTQTRAALWPLILEPKLGKLAADYHWGEQSFAEEEIVMHAKPDWLPPGYSNWDALLTEAARRGIEGGHTPADLARWSYGSWHKIDIEHPLARFLPLIGRVAGTGAQPMGGDGTTVKQIGPNVAPSQRFTMDWSDIDGSTENIVMGESGNPLSPYFRDQWKDWYNGTTFALPFSPAAVAAQTRHTLRLLP